MKKILLAPVLALALTSPAMADTAIVDFNSLLDNTTTNPYLTVGKPYLEDGFSLTTSSSSPYTGNAGGQIYATTPKNALWTGSPTVYSGVITNYGSAFVLTRQDGGDFGLLSMDAAAFQNHPNARAFNVYGYYAAGGYAHASFTLDTSFNTLETLTFGSIFQGLNKIVFSSVYAQVDNINLQVAAVPEPETYGMLLAGLGLLGFAARRRKAQG